MTEFTIRKPDDFHVHVRDGEMLARVLPFTARHFARATIMPNITPSVVTTDGVKRYRNRITSLCGNGRFQPIMTLCVNDETTPDDIHEAFAEGTIAGKAYPKNMTTGSSDGVNDLLELAPVLEAMSDIGMLLLLHGENPSPNVSALDRERSFLTTLRIIAQDFPRLRIVFEHISSADAIEEIKKMPKTVGATITVHHLCLTIDDVIGGMFQPHHFCKPIAKRPEDRNALMQAAVSGNPKFFFGSDSAPHLRSEKECAHGAAGIFTAPVALPLLAELFEHCENIDALEPFVSQFGAEFYGLPLSTETIVLEKREWIVPDEYDGIVPFCAGSALQWRVKE